MAEKRIEPGPLATQVAETVRRVREDRGLTYAKVAERLLEAGRPIPVLGLSRIERGDRRVDIDDLVALARVFRVPPLLLLFPFDQTPEVEVVPGERVPTWDAACWFAGRAPFPRWQERDELGEVIAEAGEAVDLEAFEQGAVAVELWDRHQRLLAEWRIRESVAKTAARRAKRDVSEDWEKTEQAATRARREAEAIVNSLWGVRKQMRQHGILAPTLPEVLRRVDTDKTPLHLAVERYYEQQGSDGGSQED